MHLEVSIFPRRDAPPHELIALGQVLISGEIDWPEPDGSSYQNFGHGLSELLRGEFPPSKPKSKCLDELTQPCLWILINTKEPFEVSDIIAELHRRLPKSSVEACYVNGQSCD